MLDSFAVAGQQLDSLDLKVLLLSHGVHMQRAVYEILGETHRLSPDPVECNVLILPDQTVVHVADIGPSAPFEVALGDGPGARLCYKGDFVTEVSFPPASAFYRQTTSRGMPFRGMAVLQGLDVLSFPYLWPCEYAKAGRACRFCHCGNYTQQQFAAGDHRTIEFAPQDVAEVVHYAVCVERCAKYVQLTGGSSFNANGECGGIAAILDAINALTGIRAIPGEIILYTTPPADVSQLDRLFGMGVGRIACDIEIWDEELARIICPGKYEWTGRKRHIDALTHIAETHGPGKACSTFVVGLEPAESFLAGAEFLAQRGIVPIPSIWMPHGLPPIPGIAVPDLDFYRRVRAGLAAIYDRHDCQPPGEIGFNVCLCRDTWRNRKSLLVPPETCATHSPMPGIGVGKLDFVK